jgi:hypothetical protein
LPLSTTPALRVSLDTNNVERETYSCLAGSRDRPPRGGMDFVPV